MTGEITDSGMNTVADFIVNEDLELALGTGSTSPSTTDTSLDNEVYRAADTDSSASVQSGGNIGEVIFTVTVAGGNEVPADSNISEFGVFADNGDLIYREVFNNVLVNGGETQNFEFTVDVINV